MRTSVKLCLAFLLTLLATTGKSQLAGSFQYDGLTRSYLVYVPASYTPGSNFPLVFVLHGFTQTAQNIMDVSSFNQVADTGNFIVVYPNGVGNAWNSNSGMTGGSTADDIGFIGALTDSLYAQYGIDTTRVYSCGFSAGGYMSHRLACESPRCYAAVASVAGTMSTAAYAACIPSRPVPVLQIHGTADAVVSYTGGVGGVGVDDVIAKWTTLDGCPLSPVVTALPDINAFDASTVERSVYSPCSANSEVELLKVLGGGHQWPGTTSLFGGLGTINRDIQASGEIWNFFRGKSCQSFSTSLPVASTTSIEWAELGSNRYGIIGEVGGSCRIVVYDMNGRIVMSDNESDNPSIDLSILQSGSYIIMLTSDKFSLRKKVSR